MKYTSKYIEQILTSPSAKKGLDYITPIYHQAYNALWIMQAMGLQTDVLIKWIEEYIQQILPQTTTWLLPYFEEEYGIPVNKALTIEERRKNLLFAIRIRAPMNPTKFAFILSLLTDIDDIYIKENVSKNAFYTETTVALNKEQVKKVHNIVNKYKPAHLIYWINIFTKVIFENYNFFKFHQLIMSTFIKNSLYLNSYNITILTGMKNYFVYPVLFNGERTFDDMCFFNQSPKFFPLNLIMKLFVRNNEKCSSIYPINFIYNCFILNKTAQQINILFNSFIKQKEIFYINNEFTLSVKNKMSFNIAEISAFNYNIKNKITSKLSLILNDFIKEKETISELFCLNFKNKNDNKFNLSYLKFEFSNKNTLSEQLNIAFNITFKEAETLTISLILDTMCHFDGEINGDGTRKFNAAILKINI